MKRALLNPRFSLRERRWGSYMEIALWLGSAALLMALVRWSTGPV